MTELLNINYRLFVFVLSCLIGLVFFMINLSVAKRSLSKITTNDLVRAVMSFVGSIILIRIVNIILIFLDCLQKEIIKDCKVDITEMMRFCVVSLFCILITYIVVYCCLNPIKTLEVLRKKIFLNFVNFLQSFKAPSPDTVAEKVMAKLKEQKDKNTN